MLSKKCAICGKEFFKDYNRSVRDFLERAKYCSRECQNKSLIKEKKCINCGCSFHGQNKRFCSLSCSGKYNGFKKGHPAPETAFKKGQRSWNKGKRGAVPWNKGIVWEKMRGENHWNWKGGKPKANKRETMDYKEYRKYLDWQKSVFRRDGWNCAECGKHGGVLHAHHMKPWILHINSRYLIDNGITLCPRCHQKTGTYGKHKNKMLA